MEVGQVRLLLLLLMLLLHLLLVVVMVVRRHLRSVGRRVVEALAMGGVLLLLRGNGRAVSRARRRGVGAVEIVEGEIGRRDCCLGHGGGGHGFAEVQGRRRGWRRF